MPLFQSTIWTVIERAGAGDEEALRRFVESYRPVLVAYGRHRGFPQDAEDLAQEVLLRVTRDGVLLRADPARGRFRSLLCAVADHVMGHHLDRIRARKRGSRRTVPLHDCEVPVEAATNDDFDREWVGHLLGRAFARLQEQIPHYYAVAHAFLVEGKSYAAIRAETGLSTVDVRNYLHRARRKLAGHVREQILEYCMSDQEARAELDGLSTRFLARVLSPASAGRAASL